MPAKAAVFLANYLAELTLALAIMLAMAAVGGVCYLAGRGAALVVAMLFVVAVADVAWRMAGRVR